MIHAYFQSDLFLGHKCLQCDNRYMKLSDLNRHVSVDHVSLVSCSDCGRTFRHKQHLRKHRKIHEPDAVRIPCSYEDCPRSYTMKRNLDAHIRSYHLGQRYPCTVSDCTFILSTKVRSFCSFFASSCSACFQNTTVPTKSLASS